jgi:hypothetical protein
VAGDLTGEREEATLGPSKMRGILKERIGVEVEVSTEEVVVGEELRVLFRNQPPTSNNSDPNT